MTIDQGCSLLEDGAHRAAAGALGNAAGHATAIVQQQILDERGVETEYLHGGCAAGRQGRRTGQRAVKKEAYCADGAEGADRVTYGDVFHQAEVEFSAHNFEHANTEMLFRHFEDAEKECASLLEKGLALPAYDQCIKASHNFNLLDARGVISVTERQAYIGRVRALAKGCAEAWLKTPAGGAE